MNRFARSIKVVLFILILFVLHFARDRWLYERLLNSLYITVNDFPPDYAHALRALPNDELLSQYDYSRYPQQSLENTIEPIIHFIWFADLYDDQTKVSHIPSMGSNAPEQCQKFNPGYEVKVWNSSAARTLLEYHYDWFLDTYDSYAFPIERVDAIKYFVLHHYGGFYLDLDVSCRRSLTPLQQFPAWVPRASPLGVNNDALAFRKDHPAVEKMTKMLRVRNNNLLFPYLTIFWSTGPQFTGDILKSYLEEFHGAGHKVYDGANKYPSDPDEVFVLSQPLYSEEYTFFGHSPGGTWHEGDVAVVLWFVAHPGFVMFIAASSMFAIMMFVYRRWKRTHTAGYVRVQTVEPDEISTESNAKLYSYLPRRLLYRCVQQVQILHGIRAEYRRPSIHMLSSTDHATDSEDGSAV